MTNAGCIPEIKVHLCFQKTLKKPATVADVLAEFLSLAEDRA
jgi:hypothetical protein